MASIMTAFESPRLTAYKTIHHLSLINQNFDGTLNYIHQHAFVTNASNDTYTLKDMLKQDDVADFVEAMVKEIDDHESNDLWDIINKDDMPSGTKTILAIWSFKRKRFPDGRIMKHKARLCAHGGM